MTLKLQVASLVLLSVLLIGGGSFVVIAATPTLVPTITPSPTLSFQQRQSLPTIVPPAACGLPFNPCGAIPWGIPNYATLYFPSPTIMPTVPTNTPIPITATPSPTGTVGTSTPAPSSTPVFDTGSVSTFTGSINGFSGTLMAQSTQSVPINGTPQGLVGLAQQLGSGAGQPFAYAKALQLDNVGGTGGMISFALIALAFILLIEIFIFAAPLLRTILDLALKIFSAVKPF